MDTLSLVAHPHETLIHNHPNLPLLLQDRHGHADGGSRDHNRVLAYTARRDKSASGLCQRPLLFKRSDFSALEQSEERIWLVLSQRR